MIDNQTKQDITSALKLLSESNSSIRIEAVKKLGAIGVAHPQIIERLQSIASNDASPDVRYAANHSLELLKPSPVESKPQINPPQTQLDISSQANEKAIIGLLQKQNETLENLRVLILQSTEAQNPKAYQLRARIVDIDISISSMVSLMLKWVIASIPAGIIIFFVVFFLASCTAILGN